jgi:hypothetical protein
MTVDQLKARLDLYLAAEARILQSQEYSVGDGGTARRNKRAELASVQAEITRLQQQIAPLEAAQSGLRRVLYIR